jgi:hypothetical protein
MDSLFEIAITKQGWIGPPTSKYDPELEDPCSHGDIRLVIGGEVIASGDGDGDFGISESALALLRTLESNYLPKRSSVDYDCLISHGCGAILMMSCPIGIDWSVSHGGGQVLLSDVVRYDSPDDAEAVRFPEVVVELPEDEYRRRIVAFAQKAKELFAGVEKRFPDEWDRDQYERFWGEYEELLARAGS